jgi:hypothetical protein
MRTTSSRAIVTGLIVALTGALTGCAGEPAAEPTPTEEPTGPADDDALPPGFPDPESLIGQVAYDEQTADGSWRTVVGGTPLELVMTFGACFDGGSGDICGYSISGSVPPAPDGVVQPAEVGLLLLLRSNGPLGDGTPTWLVLDAVVAQAPGGEPAYLQTCEGAPGVAIYSDPDAPLAATIPVSAAWGPDAAIASLVEVAPASLTCEAMGP